MKMLLFVTSIVFYSHIAHTSEIPSSQVTSPEPSTPISKRVWAVSLGIENQNIKLGSLDEKIAHQGYQIAVQLPSFSDYRITVGLIKGTMVRGRKNNYQRNYSTIGVGTDFLHDFPLSRQFSLEAGTNLTVLKGSHGPTTSNLWAYSGGIMAGPRFDTDVFFVTLLGKLGYTVTHLSSENSDFMDLKRTNFGRNLAANLNLGIKF